MTEPLRPAKDLPGGKVTPSLMAMAAYRVADVDPAYLTMGDDLGLVIAYESLRTLLERHANTPRTGGG